MHLWDLTDLFDSHHLTRHIDGFDLMSLFECGNKALNSRLGAENLLIMFQSWDPRFWHGAKLMTVLARRFRRARRIEFDLRKPFKSLSHRFIPPKLDYEIPLHVVFPNLQQLIMREKNGSLIACSMACFFLQQDKNIHITFPVLETLVVHQREKFRLVDQQFELGAFLEHTPRTVHDLDIWAPPVWDDADMPPIDVAREEQPKLSLSRLGVCVYRKENWQMFEHSFDLQALTSLQLQISLNVNFRCVDLPRTLQHLAIHGSDFNPYDMTTDISGPVVYFDNPPLELISFKAKTVKSLYICSPLPSYIQTFTCDSHTIDDACLISVTALPDTLLILKLSFGSVDGIDRDHMHHLFEPILDMDPERALHTLKRLPPKLKLFVKYHPDDQLVYQISKYIYSKKILSDGTVVDDDADNINKVLVYSACMRYLSLLDECHRSNPTLLWLHDVSESVSNSICDISAFQNLVGKHTTSEHLLKMLECPPKLGVRRIDAGVFKLLSDTTANHMFPNLNEITCCESLERPVPKQFVAVKTTLLCKTSFEDVTAVKSLRFAIDSQSLNQKEGEILASLINLRHVTAYFYAIEDFLDMMRYIPKSVESIILKGRMSDYDQRFVHKTLPSFDASLLPPNLRYLAIKDFYPATPFILTLVKSIKATLSLHRLVFSFSSNATTRSHKMHVHSMDDAGTLEYKE